MKFLRGIAATLGSIKFIAVSTCMLHFVAAPAFGAGRPPAASRHIQYLQVEANEGNSSGGHTALRFAKETFHFQHEASGLLRIHRLDSKAFDHIYAVLDNRAIQESWISVSPETYDLLLAGFQQFLIIQDEQLRILDILRQDVSLFEILLEQKRNGQRQPSSLPLKGVGYFLPNDQVVALSTIEERACAENSGRQSSPALRELKARVSSVYGDNFLEQRISLAEATLREMKLEAVKSASSELSADIYPNVTSSPSTSYNESLSALFALRLLQIGPELVPGSYWSHGNAIFVLTPGERLFLRSFAEKLQDNLFRLLSSPRSDWGGAFFVGMARLAAIEASLASGRIVFLDIYPPVELLENPQPWRGRRYLPAKVREAEELFLLKRQAFFAGPEMGEADFAALELLGNNLLELQRSIESGLQPRPLPETPIPSRSAWLSDVVRPDMSEGELKRQLESARFAEKEYAKAISNLYKYDLLRRNCVTELFAFINKSLTRSSAVNKQTGQFEVMIDAESVRIDSQQRLGGYIDPAQGLNFIPAVSAAEVDACYTVTAKREQPSYRARQLAEMKKHESSLLVFLRESNTITSTIYQRPLQDSPFLFFTDDTFMLRPVFGVFNLLVGVGESLLGLVTLPLEGTNRLYLGAKGVLFSLPELVFICLRKGTMEYVAEIR